MTFQFLLSSQVRISVDDCFVRYARNAAQHVAGETIIMVSNTSTSAETKEPESSPNEKKSGINRFTVLSVTSASSFFARQGVRRAKGRDK